MQASRLALVGAGGGGLKAISSRAFGSPVHFAFRANYYIRVLYCNIVLGVNVYEVHSCVHAIFYLFYTTERNANGFPGAGYSYLL